MRKFSFLALLMAICASAMFYSCNSNDWQESGEPGSISPEVVMVENPFLIGKEKAIDNAMEFLSETGLESNQTLLRSFNLGKAKVETKVSNYAISLVKKLGSKKQVLTQTIPVYTINFKNEDSENSGFVVTVGDDRFTKKDVLIYSNEKGARFDLEAREDADFLKDMIAGYLHNKVNNVEMESSDFTSEKKHVENVTQPRSQEYEGYSTPTVEIRPTYELYVVGCQACWPQLSDPYTRYTPFRNGRRAAVGCTAIAMGEIMANYKWPQYGTYKRYTTNAPQPEVVQINYADISASDYRAVWGTDYLTSNTSWPAAEEYVANLVSEIGYKLNTDYTASGTLSLAYPWDVPAVFREMGYLSDACTDYSLEKIKTDIITRKIPVFMAGWKENGGGGHAYVVRAYEYRKTNKQSYICVMNGDIYKDTGMRWFWFNAEMFTTKYNNHPYVPQPDDPENVVYEYRYSCEVVTNIRKNLNNPGSTNPEWKVRYHNPY